MLYFIGVTVLSTVFVHPVFLAVSLSGALALYIGFRGKNALRFFFGAMLPLWVIVTAFNTLTASYGETVLFSLFGHSFTLEAIVFGAVTGCEAITVTLWFMCWSCVVDEEKFSFVFGKRFPSAALVVMLILRFVPMYIDNFTEIYAVRRIADGGKRRFRSGVRALAGVTGAALEKSIDTAISMKARGCGLDNKTRFSHFRFRFADAVFALFFASLMAAVPVLCRVGGVDASFEPVIRISALSLPGIAGLCLYFILCFLPVILSLAEVIRWNRYFAKI